MNFLISNTFRTTAAIIFAVLLSTGCDKKNPVGAAKGPALELSVSSLNFSDAKLRATLQLFNRGEQTLTWRITLRPDWLEVSPDSGTVSGGSSLTLFLDADSLLPNGEYRGNLVIESNGGPASIPLEFILTTRPELSVSTQQLDFTIDQTEAIVLIANGGPQALRWQARSKPDWLLLSKTSGEVTSVADTIVIRADVGRENGTYAGSILIDSNGGQAAIAATLLIDFKIEIFPGSGGAGIGLGNPYSAVLAAHGAPESSALALVSGVGWLHIKSYPSKGIEFAFVTSSPTLKSTDPVLIILLESPYAGLTPERLGIGTALAEITSAYGEPEEIDRQFRWYEYNSKGIDFKYDPAETEVTTIRIYPPITNSKAAATTVIKGELSGRVPQN